nr:DNA-directed DNA polymerase [Tanacetum cinerariifolium]
MRTRSRSRHQIAEPLRIEFPFQEDQFQEDPPEVPMADNRTMAQLLQAPTLFPKLQQPILSLSTVTCPHHGFSELHQLDTLYNALNVNDQDSLNFAASGNFLDKIPSERLKIIESKSKVRQSRAKAIVAKVNSSSFTLTISSDVAGLKDMDSLNFAASGNFLDKIPSERLKIIESKSKVRQSRAKAIVAKVNSSSFTLTISSDVAGLKDMVNQRPAYQAPAYQAPIPQMQGVSQTDFERFVKANDAVLRNIQSQGQSTQNQCQMAQNQYQNMQNQLANLTDMVSKLLNSNIASFLGSGTLPSNTITNPKEDLKGITTRSGVAYQGPTIPTSSKVVKQRTEFASTLKALIGNKDKLSEMARTLMNEHCSAVILNKLPKKLGDPGKFLIPFEFPRMDECLALADLGASISFMPLFVWEELLLPKLTPTCMTLKLADRTESKPVGIAKDVSVKVGVFQFPADFVVVDFEPDPRVPLILERCFLKTGRALIDVHKGELTLRIKNEAITYNLDQTSRYSANYDQMTANKINVTNEACEEYSQEVLGFSDVTASGSPTPSDDPIVSTTSPTLTPFGDSDF